MDADLDPDAMEQAAAELISLSYKFSAAAHQVNGAMERAGCEGPFFSEMELRLSHNGNLISMGGRGLRTVGLRLRADVPAARAAALRPKPTHGPTPR